MATVRKLSRTPIKTAKVKMLSGTVLGPGQVGRVGEIYELPKHLATQLVNMGQAEYTDEGDPSEHDDAGAKANKDGYDVVTVEKPDSRDPKPKRRG
jgi:hypothetical protein